MANNEAKQKAKELIESFIAINGNSFFAKQCAIKVCDEVINEIDYYGLRFWRQVKKEIENYEQ